MARAVAAVRGFYRFLVLDRRSTSSPADDLRPPRAWPALPKFLSLEEVDALIAQPDVATPLGLRDRAMIELLYATGMRVSELVGVRAADLHLDEQYLTCIGKGNKERLMPIGEQAADWVARYQRDGAAGDLLQGPRVAAAVRQRARRAAQPRRLLEDSEGVRPPGRPAARRSARTSCGIRSRRTCSSAAPTCARSR